MSRFDLTGRAAIVTGGNGGIGLGMARGLAQAGASVVIAGRDKAKNAKATAELREAGARAIDIVADVTQEESCRALIAAAVKAFGRLDILVNNAGIGIIKQPQEFTLAEWNSVLATNLSSAFLCARAAYPEIPIERSALRLRAASNSWRSTIARCGTSFSCHADLGLHRGTRLPVSGSRSEIL